MRFYNTLTNNKEEFKLEIWDKWILSRLNSLVIEMAGNYDQYNFDGAAKALYSFFWDNFCDWYVEITKPILYGNDEAGHG